MNEFITAFTQFAVLLQKPVHGTGGAQILAFIQQRGVNGGGSAILEALFMQDREQAVALFVGERAWRRGARRCRHRGRGGLGRWPEHRALTVEGGARHAESGAGGLDSHIGREREDRVHQSFSWGFSGRGGSISMPTFF
jgi:hypothetical protein